MAEPLARVHATRVAAPVGGIYRVARWPDPLAFPPMPDPLPAAELDPLAPAGPQPLLDGNRFDDAHGRLPGLYVASTAEAAFGETLARFRERPQAWDLLESALDGAPDAGEPQLDRGVVPPDWPHSRNLSHSAVRRSAEFVDGDASDTHVEIAREMPDLLAKYRLRDIDRGVVLASDRRITRLIASYFGAQRDRCPRLAGLRYESRIRKRPCPRAGVVGGWRVRRGTPAW